MSTTTEARPDLSALDRETRLRIAVSQTQGHKWWRGENLISENWPGEECWRLGSVGLLTERGYLHTASDPLTDPAAWGALLAGELEGYDTYPWNTEGCIRCWWYPTGPLGLRHYGPWAADLPHAVVFGVLAKHGVPVPE